MTGSDDTPSASGDRAETDALTALLRDERAAVVVTVALAGGATTYGDRTRCERLGGQLVVLCCALRERLDLAGRVVTSGINYDTQAMLAIASYDERLAALADFLAAAAQRATAALAVTNDGAYARTLRDLIAAHAEAAQWLRERAAAFAATRPDDGPPEEMGAGVTPEGPSSTTPQAAAGDWAQDAARTNENAAHDDATP